ncbi:OsmC family protein [Sinorhizobium mexicanum]|uniref:OsmC family protein n=1 Tax=Sinorhizobium mexicanum TaxID=375549 RepID=A0A859R474_9HYPH|nr:OsmC family protein [Sinorhizobium mexicanum]MBP1888329.1 pyruvate dehydrogenase E2 component (dihydrolipoamide acetyltransferase) [Sinorhizobium mexicanum]QLL64408.1 OsmC family protein [Sinorhizobium mexicanum]
MDISMDSRQPLSELGRRFATFRDASANPDECLETMSGTTRQVGGLRSESLFSGLPLTIDEPVSFGGTGKAPNPAEVMLAALGASIEVTMRCYADYFGIVVESIGVELTAELNTQGFFGTSPAVRSGFRSISARVKIVSEEEPHVISKLIEIANRFCPVLDNVRHPTEVTLTLDIARTGD